MMTDLNAYTGVCQAITRKNPLENDNNLTGNNLGSVDSYDTIINSIKCGHKVMVLMRGLPGSGKSTLARQLLNKSLGNVNLDEFIFSVNQYSFKSAAYVEENEELMSARQWNQKRCFSGVRKGVSPIVIDNNNLEMSEMQVYCVMAAKYGYIIEIAVPLTNWALDPIILASKNTHGIDKSRIEEMLQRFQQHLTVKDLFNEFQIAYTDVIPQNRKYPPIAVRRTRALKPRIAPPMGHHSTEQKQVAMPVEYVHKFELNHKPALPKKLEITTDQPFHENIEAKAENLNIINSVSGLNEHQLSPKKDESMESIDIEILSEDPESEELVEAVNEETLRSLLMKEEDINSIDVEISIEPLNNEEAIKSKDVQILAEPVTIDESNVETLAKPPKKDEAIRTIDVEVLAKRLEENNELMSSIRTFLSQLSPLIETQRLAFDKSTTESATHININESTNIPIKEEQISILTYDSKACGPDEPSLVSKATSTSTFDLTIVEKKDIVETHDQSTNTTAENFEFYPNVFDNETSNPNDTIIGKGNIMNKESLIDTQEIMLKLNYEEREQVKKLKEVFPNMRLEELLDVYQRNRKQFFWTLDSITKLPSHLMSPSGSESGKRSRYSELSRSKSGTFSLDSIATSPSKVENIWHAYGINSNLDFDGNDEGISEDFVDLNLDKNPVRQLETMFGQLKRKESSNVVVQMPKTLARRLHALCIEYSIRQTQNFNEHMSNQLKEDEYFAARIEDEELADLSRNYVHKNVEELRNITPDILAMQLTQKRLHTHFPRIKPAVLDGILKHNKYNYTRAVKEILKAVHPRVPSSNVEKLLIPPISDATLNEMRKLYDLVNKETNDPGRTVNTSAFYRDQANRHMTKRQQLVQLVQTQPQKRCQEVISFYMYLAQVELKKAKVYNQHSMRYFIDENAEILFKGDTLNLHSFPLKSAISILDLFLDYHILNLKTDNKSHHHYFVITDRGKENDNGLSMVRSAVMDRLKIRNVQYMSINPGILQIKMHKNLPISTDLDKPKPRKTRISASPT